MGGNFGELIIRIWIIASRGGNNQWSPGFINKNRVDLIDDGEIKFALAEEVNFVHHVVTEIIEAKFVIGTISHISLISLFSGTRFQVLHAFVSMFFINIFWIIKEAGVSNNHTYTHTEEVINWSIPTGVTLSKIIVHGDDVDAAASQGIQERWQKRYQGFTFASFHFGDVAFVENDTTNHLNVIVAHAKDTLSSFAH